MDNEKSGASVGQCPSVGGRYVCSNTAPRGWRGDVVVVIDVDLQQRTARVKYEGPIYETVVSWDDLAVAP